MEDFDIIDVHNHLCRTEEEERDYFPIPGRRAHDRWATPERAIEYMNRNGISAMAFMILIPRQQRAPLFQKAKLADLPEGQRPACPMTWATRKISPPRLRSEPAREPGE